MKSTPFIIASVSLGMLAWVACNKKEKNVLPPDPEKEVITTVRLVATNIADTADVVTAQWRDLTPNDGDPDLTKARMTLRKDAVYTVDLTYLDETQSPPQDVTYEIRDRANYHLICYARDAALNLIAERTDHDNNNPQQELGLKSRFTTGAVSSGSLDIALHHQPNGKNGDCRVGATDAEVTFRITIQ